MRELYVIEFESANYAGAHETCLVWATSEDDARAEFEQSGWGEEFFYEQDHDQYIEENGDDDGVMYCTFKCAVRLEGSSYEQYAKMESQRGFYQIVN